MDMKLKSMCLGTRVSKLEGVHAKIMGRATLMRLLTVSPFIETVSLIGLPLSRYSVAEKLVRPV